MIDDQVTSRRIVVYAAIAGAGGVLLGAFGAHGLEAFLQQRSDDAAHVAKRVGQFDVAVRYHLIHAVALFALAALPCGSSKSRRITARLFAIGLLLFSGSLYLLVLTDSSRWGMITPIGGLIWIAGWLSLIWVAKHDPTP